MEKRLRRNFILEGDKTTAGGVVVEGHPAHSFNGRGTSFQGAKITCPACKSTGVIRCVAPIRTFVLPNGQQAALENDLCICKCKTPPKLVASQTFAGMNFDASELNGVSSAANTAVNGIHDLVGKSPRGGGERPTSENSDQKIYDERPELTAPPIEGLPYYVETMDGRIFSGRTGADGLLPRIDTNGEDEYTVYWGDEALTKMEGATS